MSSSVLVHDLQASLAENLPAHTALRGWLAECVQLCRPERVQILDGSSAEKQDLIKQAVAEGVLIRLNQDKLPGCYLHRSHPNDVARTEQCTFICTPSENLAGPTNNWMPRAQGLRQAARPVRRLHARPDHVRHPVRHGAARLAPGPGRRAADRLDLRRHQHGHHDAHGQGRPGSSSASDGDFTRCLHSVGDCDPERRYICHFPQDNTIWSFGSGYGGNACWARSAWPCAWPASMGYQRRLDGRAHAAHGRDQPAGGEDLHRRRLSQRLRQDQLRHADSARASTARPAGRSPPSGDDIVWMHVKPDDGRLWAINPEAGYFGVRARHQRPDQPQRDAR